MKNETRVKKIKIAQEVVGEFWVNNWIDCIRSSFVMPIMISFCIVFGTNIFDISSGKDILLAMVVTYVVAVIALIILVHIAFYSSMYFLKFILKINSKK